MRYQVCLKALQIVLVFFLAIELFSLDTAHAQSKPPAPNKPPAQTKTPSPGKTPTQDKKQPSKDFREEAAKSLFGGTAQVWLDALLASSERIESLIYLDRLSYYRLSSSQSEQLRLASEQEESSDKRVMLWQAMRLSQDPQLREYLIKTLNTKSSLDLQVLFLDGLQNPSSFDVPILVSLYNSHRPRKRTPLSKKKGNAKPGQSKSRSGADDTDRPLEETAEAGQRGKKFAPQELRVKQLGSANFGDLFDVPSKMADMICFSDWNSFTHMTGAALPDEKNSPEAQDAWLKVFQKRSRDAVQAHEELVYWLIKSGIDESHRINAFREYMTDHYFSHDKKIYANIGWELLQGMNTPEYRVEALRLAENRIDPTRLLEAHEPELVRLEAINAMQRKFLGLYRSPQAILFEKTLAYYKTILDNLQNTDASPKVRGSAKQLYETILQCEKEYRKTGSP